MKLLARICLLVLLGSLGFLPQSASAQDKSPEKPKAKPIIPMKVQIVFTEMDGEKKTSSLPYSFSVLVDDKPSGRYSANLRTGVRVPVEVDGKDQKTSYIDIGTNIDCGIHEEEDGKFRVYVNFERSALFPNKAGDGERLVMQPNGQPLVRQLRLSDELLLKDGQTSDMILSTDPLSGHVLKASVTINIVK
jgi:hypothetical protein